MDEKRVKAYLNLLCDAFDIHVVKFMHLGRDRWPSFLERHNSVILEAIEQLPNSKEAHMLRMRLGVSEPPQTLVQLAEASDLTPARVGQIIRDAGNHLRQISSFGLIAKELMELGYNTSYLKEASEIYETALKLSNPEYFSKFELSGRGRFLFDHSAGCSSDALCATCEARHLLRKHGIEEDFFKLHEKWHSPEFLEMDPLLVWPVWSLRTRNCLTFHNIRTVRMLVESTEDDMLRIQNFGRKSLAEVKTSLQQYGLDFRKSNLSFRM